MSRFARIAPARRAVASLLVLSAATAAQNGSNYHVLNNGADGVLIGVGAGGTQTAQDGLGTYIPGEDLRGSLLADPDGGGPLGVQFSYRMNGFTESVCLLTPGLSGNYELRFPALFFIELDGLDPNQPAVFTQPICSTPLTASFIPYGFGPGSNVSFVTAAATTFFGPQTVLLPDNGLVAGSGTATTVMEFDGVATGALPSGCYFVQFGVIPSVVPFADGIDGLWHYAVNSDDGNQYWQLSLDEMNLWQSNTVATDAGATTTQAFASVVDYAMLLISREANTHAALAPHGLLQDGPYYHQTENMARGGGPNFGFDIGRGSHAVSFSGLGGVKVPPALGGLGNGAQDPAYGPGNTVPTLGFVTFDNKVNQSFASIGSVRVTWVSVDLALLAGLPPGPGVTKEGGTVRLPVESDGFPQPLTQRLLPVFFHKTSFAANGWPHPAGLPSGAFGVAAVAGGSVHVALSGAIGQVPCNIGLPIAVQYGSSGKNPNHLERLTFDPQLADISGRKELYLIP